MDGPKRGAITPWCPRSPDCTLTQAPFAIYHRGAIGHSHALSAVAPVGATLSIMSNRWVVQQHRLPHYRAVERGLACLSQPTGAMGYGEGERDRQRLWFAHFMETCIKWVILSFRRCISPRPVGQRFRTEDSGMYGHDSLLSYQTLFISFFFKHFDNVSCPLHCVNIQFGWKWSIRNRNGPK